MLVNGSILRRAKRKYAIGAFDVNNMEMVKAVAGACAEERAPVVIQTTEKAIDYAGIDYLSSMIKTASRAPVPVVMHLDHGKSVSTVKTCIAHGYTSVMFDGSRLPLDKNVKLTKHVVSLARKKRVTVEGELGVIPGKEDYVGTGSMLYTDPRMAERFVEATKVDGLAVSIGTKHGLTDKEVAHGMKKGQLKIRLDILKEINERVGVPLVLHGGSDVPASQLKKCIRLGIAKVNIDTELRVAFRNAVGDFIKHSPSVYDPRAIMAPAMESMRKVVKKKVIELGSAGKA